VREYCVGSDLVSTAYLYKELEPHIDLREKMSIQFGTDLRSKSDAQIAEVTNYIRSQFGNAYTDLITPAEVAALRPPEDWE
jgi:hypothetical protein